MQETNLHPGISLRLFCFAFCTTSSHIVCRIVADAMFLTRVGTIALPPMLVGSALVVGAMSYMWARRTKNLPLGRLIVSTQLTGAALTALLLTLVSIWPQSMLIICCIFVLAELRGCFSVIQLTVLLNENLCSRSETQKFALVNAGSPVAGIVIGLFLGAEAEKLPPGLLLVLSCVLDVCAIFTIRRTTNEVRVTDPVGRLSTHAPPSVVLTTSDRQRDSLMRNRTLAQAILWIVVCKTIVLAVVTFEWKIYASQIYPNDERALAAYFGLFCAITDGLILFLQLFVTRFLLKHVGVSLSLLVLPVYLTILGIVSLATQNVRLLFYLLTAARGSIVIRWGIHQVAIQILYGELPGIIRRGTVSRVLGIAKPLAEAGAAGTIGILVLYLPIHTFAWFWLPVVAIWLWWTGRVVLATAQTRARATPLTSKSTPDNTKCSMTSRNSSPLNRGG